MSGRYSVTRLRAGHHGLARALSILDTNTGVLIEAWLVVAGPMVIVAALRAFLGYIPVQPTVATMVVVVRALSVCHKGVRFLIYFFY